MEAKYYEKDRGQFRSQSQYYLYNGRFWQYVGLLAAVLVGMGMVVIQVLALSCIPVISSFSGGCTLKSGGFQYVNYGLFRNSPGVDTDCAIWHYFLGSGSSMQANGGYHR